MKTTFRVLIRATRRDTMQVATGLQGYYTGLRFSNLGVQRVLRESKARCKV